MTQPQDIAVTLARFEGKLDTLAVKVDAGDKAASGLVELVRTELANVQTSVAKLEATVSAGLEKADANVSRVRVDLERQVTEVARKAEFVVEAQGQVRRRVYERIEALDRFTNRLAGGLLLASARGVSGLVALVKGW
jgi:hypothetical protein